MADKKSSGEEEVTGLPTHALSAPNGSAEETANLGEAVKPSAADAINNCDSEKQEKVRDATGQQTLVLSTEEGDKNLAQLPNNSKTEDKKTAPHGRIIRHRTSPTRRRLTETQHSQSPRSKSEGEETDEFLMKIIAERSRADISNYASEQTTTGISTNHQNCNDKDAPRRCIKSPVSRTNHNKRPPLPSKSEGSKTSITELGASQNSQMDEELAKIIAKRSRDDNGTDTSRDALNSLEMGSVNLGGTLEGLQLTGPELMPLPSEDTTNQQNEASDPDASNYSRNAKKKIDGPVQPGAHGVAPGVRPNRIHSLRYSVAMQNPNRNDHLAFPQTTDELATEDVTPPEESNSADSANGINQQPAQSSEANDIPRQEEAPSESVTLGLSRLVSARQVDPESDLFDAESISMASEYVPPSVQVIRKRRCLLLGSLGVIFIFISSLVVVVLHFNHVFTPKETTQNTLIPASSSTVAPTPLRIPLLRETEEIIRNHPGSPQARAYNWLLHDMLVKPYSDARLLQRYVLVTFFFSTNGNDWSHNQGWLSHDLDECNWQTKWIEMAGNSTGICNENGFYLRLLLTNNGLTGSLPPELGLLSNLLVLDVAGNEIAGTIPSELVLLPAIIELAVDDNQLSGHVPTEILGELTNLETLLVHTNPLSGTIPTFVGLLTGLEMLAWSRTETRGNLPTQLGLLSKMTLLHLDDNMLEGNIPSEIFMMTSLSERLVMGDNSFTGTLPCEIGRLWHLGEVYLGNNLISGQIPTEVGTLQNATKLFLYKNKLRGIIPSQVGQLLQLERINFFGNELTGPIPSDLGNCKNLSHMDFEINQLSSSIPLGVLQELNLTTLYLNSNDLHGPVPSEIGHQTALKILRLDSTNLKGTLPSEVGSLISLVELRLDNTGISGQIPTEFADVFGNLKILKVHNTSLSGTLPSESCDVPELDFNCTNMLCGCSCSCPNAG